MCYIIDAFSDNMQVEREVNGCEVQIMGTAMLDTPSHLDCFIGDYP